MSNKRKNERVSCLVPIEGKRGSLFDRTKTVNISQGGLGVVSQGRIPLNKEIAIELSLKEEEEPIVVLGKVRWVTSIAQSEFFRVGLSFENILRGSRARLKEYFGT